MQVGRPNCNPDELWMTCTPETNRLLFELVGPTRLNSATEESFTTGDGEGTTQRGPLHDAE